MCDSCRHRSAHPPWNKQFRYLAAVLLSTVLLCIGSATAWAEESIVLDLVRHGESAANAAGVLDNLAPGTGLTPTGEAQATAIADLLKAAGPYAGTYAGELIRAQETAAPLAEMLNMPVQILPGLNEIPAGIFNGYPMDSLQGILYDLAPVAWVLGFPLVPDLGDLSVNGVTFDESFGGAVQTIYDNTVSAGGATTDAAFSSEGAMAVWTMMNVKNPDFSVVLQQLLTTGQLLPNGGQVVVEGSPGDWTLLSYAGTPVPQNPGLPTELFVDVRDLITAPQFAAYNIWEALGTGDPTTIANAIQSGVGEVGAATVHFPLAVTQDLVGALGGGIQDLVANPAAALNLDALLGGLNLGGLWGDLANLLPTIATEFSALLPGELAAMVGAALTVF
jgi:hypothetical protein